MNKKILVILAIMFMLCGCGKKEEKVEPFYFNDKYYEKSEIVEIKAEKYEELVNDNESFGLFVYLPGCTSCAAFRKVLNEFLESNTMTFYSMPVAEMQKTDINDYVKYAPSFVIFKDGKKVAFLDSVSDADLRYFETVDGYKEWLTRYVKLKEE